MLMCWVQDVLVFASDIRQRRHPVHRARRVLVPEMIAHIPLASHPRPKKVLVIGGGDGGVVCKVLRHPSVKQTVFCDIEEAVVRVAKPYLPHVAALLASPRVRVHISNSFTFLATYDAVITDSSHSVSPAVALFQPPYTGGGVWVTVREEGRERTRIWVYAWRENGGAQLAMWVYAWGKSGCARLAMGVACGLQEAGQGGEGQRGVRRGGSGYVGAVDGIGACGWRARWMRATGAAEERRRWRRRRPDDERRGARRHGGGGEDSGWRRGLKRRREASRGVWAPDEAS
ncbi:hypothetical protein K439DRAFT_1665917 [Ramaria rubella]|nr:hypothetical protein K439DRAFT_1665917 [Ramaria rubella]